MEGLAHANAVLNSSNYAVITQLAQPNTAMGEIQVQLKTEYSSETTRTKRKYYYWRYGSNFYHGNKACPTKKVGNKHEAYYKRKWGQKKGVQMMVWGDNE